MNCPYDRLTLQIALLGVARKMDKYVADNGEGSLDTLLTESQIEVPKEGAELNKQAADHHGISIETLVNSPNYATLKEDYALAQMRKTMDVLKSKVGLTDEEAWACMLAERL